MSNLKDIQRDWNDLAEIDPLWAIASVPDKSFNRWELDEFFESGNKYIDEALDLIRDMGLSLNKGTVLDFGCGVGRLTQALAREFKVCYGVDISPKMIELANEFNRYGDRCQYVLNPKPDLSIFNESFFDFIYTAEVLQHLPIELTQKYIEEFVRTLKPGGLAVFQMPVKRLKIDLKKEYMISLPKYHPRRIVNKLQGVFIGHDQSAPYYRLRNLGFSRKWLYEKFGFRPFIQMNILDEAMLINLVNKYGAEVVNVVDKTHPEMINKLFVVRKLLI